MNIEKDTHKTLRQEAMETQSIAFTIDDLVDLAMDAALSDGNGLMGYDDDSIFAVKSIGTRRSTDGISILHNDDGSLQADIDSELHVFTLTITRRARA